MRKTKNLKTTLKALVLIFALSFLCTIQSNAQSRNTSLPDIAPQEALGDADFTTWNFFGWLKTIVTLDMSRNPRKQKPGQLTPNDTPEAKRFIENNGPSVIVTPDMTVRDPDND